MKMLFLTYRLGVFSSAAIGAESLPDLSAWPCRNKLCNKLAKTGETLQVKVFPPAWGYLTNICGLQQIPVAIEGKTLKTARLSALIEHTLERGLRVSFVQPQFATQNARLVARKISGEVLGGGLTGKPAGNRRQILNRAAIGTCA